MARPSQPLTLSPEEADTLRALTEDRGSPAKLARQASIILLLSEGLPGTEVARRTGTSAQTVCTWRMRFLRERMASLQLAAAATRPAAPARPEGGGDIPMRPVTLQHIADLVQAHKSTVHRILRRGADDDSDLARRIRVAARDLGYRPEANHAARQLSLRRFMRQDDRRQILFYLPTASFSTAFFLRQFTGAMGVLAGTRFDVLIRLSDDLAQRQLPVAIERGEVAAVVSLDTPDWLVIEHRLLGRVHPTLRPPLIGLLTGLPETWSVSVDFHAAGRQAMAHLLDLGHRRMIAIEERPAYTAGLRAELATRGLDPDQALVARHAIPGSEIGSHAFAPRIAETLRRLLAAQPGATAFLAANDPMAIIATRVLADLGRAVPQAMSVVGFDDTDPIPGPGGANQLTSVALPLEELGAAAARMAIDPGPSPRQVLLEAGLRVRTTTRRPAG